MFVFITITNVPLFNLHKINVPLFNFPNCSSFFTTIDVSHFSTHECPFSTLISVAVFFNFFNLFFNPCLLIISHDPRCHLWLMTFMPFSDGRAWQWQGVPSSNRVLQEGCYLPLHMEESGPSSTQDCDRLPQPLCKFVVSWTGLWML